MAGQQAREVRGRFTFYHTIFFYDLSLVTLPMHYLIKNKIKYLHDIYCATLCSFYLQIFIK